MHGQGLSLKLRTFISLYVKLGYCCLLALEGLCKGKNYYFSYVKVQDTCSLISSLFLYVVWIDYLSYIIGHASYKLIPGHRRHRAKRK